MGAEPENPAETPGPAHEGEAAPVESAAAQAAETERMVGKIVDDGLKAAGVDPGGPPPAPPDAQPDGMVEAFVDDVLDEMSGTPSWTSTGPTAGPRTGPDAGPAAQGVPATAPTIPGGPSLSPDEIVDLTLQRRAAAAADLSLGLPSAADPNRRVWIIAGTALVGLLGFLAALILLGGSPDSNTPAASGAAIVASPTSVATQVATPDATPDATVEPTPASTTAATAAPTPVPQSVTLRGPIDVREYTRTGLQVGQHDLELVVFLDTGEVTGSFVIVLEEFPIGALLAGMAENLGGGDDPDLAVFKKCTVRLVLAGDATGTYDAGTGKLSGTAEFDPATNDVHDCLKTRPSNLTIDPDDAVEASTVKWSAAFDGRQAKGKLGLDQALPFTATPVE